LIADDGAVHFVSGPKAVPLIELYTSEGCSSCPPAEAWLGSLADDPGLWRDFVPVAFHVDYWDRLGWKDAFARPGHARRQYAYAAQWGSRQVYTPSFVYQGQEWRDRSRRPTLGSGGMLRVDGAATGAWRIRFTPTGDMPVGAYEAHVARLLGGVASKVRTGENAGRHLRHEFVVATWRTLPLTSASREGSDRRGDWLGEFDPQSWTLPGGVTPERTAWSIWITHAGRPEPVQAAGGWAP